MKREIEDFDDDNWEDEDWEESEYWGDDDI